MSKKKPNTRDIMNLFVEKFEGDKPFTPSQHRMNGIKLSQLRKNVKQYIEDNNIETNLSVNEIIIDTIEYSSMIGMKFRSIASLGYEVHTNHTGILNCIDDYMIGMKFRSIASFGYEVLPESIEYWKKRRSILKDYNKDKEKDDIKVIKESDDTKRKRNNRPKWLNDEGW